MQFLRVIRGGVDGCRGQSEYRRIVATTIGCVKLAYDTDSALAASGNGAGPPPIVSRQASWDSQSS
jgi:hypothetical protein